MNHYLNPHPPIPVNDCNHSIYAMVISTGTHRQKHRDPKESFSVTAPLSLKTVRLYLSVLSCILLIPWISRAETVSQSSTGLSLTVSPDGRYAVQSQTPPFRFGGDLGTPLSDLGMGAGMDNLGSYQEIAFHYTSSGQRAASVRIYAEKPIVLFSVTYLEAAPNAARFPSLTDYPSQLFHLTYSGIFGAHRFGVFAQDSPWVFFDAAAN